jgi:predicted transposase/invertase (TIGR01784 family)
LGESDIDNDCLHRWLAFFNRDTNEETLKKIIKMDRAIAKAQARMALVLRDEDALRAYQMWEMAMLDYTSGLNHTRRESLQEGIAIGEQRGMAIGKQQGKDKTCRAIVHNAASKGISAESISEFTGLTVEKVRDILKINEKKS